MDMFGFSHFFVTPRSDVTAYFGQRRARMQAKGLETVRHTAPVDLCQRYLQRLGGDFFGVKRGGNRRHELFLCVAAKVWGHGAWVACLLRGLFLLG